MWHYFHLPVIIFCHKGPKILFGCSKTCESDCEAIKIRFTDGLVTQFLLDWSSNGTSFLETHYRICLMNYVNELITSLLIDSLLHKNLLFYDPIR